MNFTASLNSISIIIFLITISGSLFSQSVKIRIVDDGNHFELQNGQTVRLADLYIPCYSDTNKDLSRISVDIERWGESYLQGRKFDVKYVRLLADSTFWVYLHRSYAMGDEEDIAKLFLENGYAVCINNSAMAKKYEYEKSELKAKAAKLGIWSLVPSDYFNNIDSSYYDTSAYNKKKTELEKPVINRKIFEAKLKMIHLLDSEKYDSLDLFIKHCDSLSFPSDRWLSNNERYFLELFMGHMDFIRNVQNYKSYLDLQDTALVSTRHTNYSIMYWAYESGKIVDSSNSIEPEVYLLKYLLLNFRKKVASLKEKYAGYDYLWDFMDFFYNKNLITSEDLNNKATAYFLKYPVSPLINFVRYSFIWKTEPLNSGVRFGLGYGVFGYDDNTSKLFLPRGNWSIWMDMYFSGVNVSFAMYRGYSLQTRSDVTYGNTTIQSGANIFQGSESLTAGYLFRITPKFDITPYSGFAYTQTMDGDKELQSLYAFQTGIKADIYLGTHEESELFIAGDYMLRAEAGVIFNDYRKIRPDLGGSSIYFSVGFIFSHLWRGYYYTFNNEGP